MPTDDQIVAWKTSAWKDSAAVSNFARRLAQPSGPALLKNRVELAALARHSIEGKLLDVGVGTGRASLPLASARRAITGVDVSRAMLRECEARRGSTPVELVEADFLRLPFESASFETVISIDALTHFPNWRHILAEMRRVTVPCGRVIFDVGSVDHDCAFAQARRFEDAEEVRPVDHSSVMAYTVRASADEICEFASEAGMTVRALVPYGILAGSAAGSRFFENTPMGGHAWDRLLSWASQDTAFFDFLVFLEEAVFAKLPAVIARRFLVVLENEAAPGANQAYASNNAARAAALRNGLSSKTLSAAGVDVNSLRGALAEHLTHEPNRIALDRLLLASLAWRWPIAVSEFLKGGPLAEASAVLGRGVADHDFTRFVSQFHQSAALRDAFTYRGVDIGTSWEADFLMRLLEGPVRAYDGTLYDPIGSKS